MALILPQDGTPLEAIPAKAGIGLKFEHITDILETMPALGWFEVHAENYMGDGGQPVDLLHEVARHYPVSIHGVGLSIGGADDLDAAHLTRLARLIDAVNPGQVSEHLAWCTIGGDHFSDLLPLPYTREALDIVCVHVDQVQDRLGRRILIENPSLYVAFAASEMPETAFLNELTHRTGCGLILDVNNVYVSAHNLGYDAAAYLDDLETGAVGEIHLAGHLRKTLTDRTLLIDDHGGPVADPVWDLYVRVLSRTGRVPTLIEWDNAVPTLDVLAGEAARADAILDHIDTPESGHVRAA
jgi:uncharacterized protein (UPF0276 family)